MTTKTIPFTMRAILAFGTILTAALLFSIAMPFNAKAATTMTGYLSIGTRSSAVTNLQSFLATNPDIYPAGLVTGYFGPLTFAAVQQFQAHYGIDQVGRFGPQTLAQFNALINAGVGLDVRSTTIFGSSVTPSNTSANVNWTTDTTANGKVYYSTNPMTMIEATGGRTTPIIQGSVASNTNFSTSQNVTVTGLQPNTTYYYVIMSTDVAGNVSVTNQSTFRTNQ